MAEQTENLTYRQLADRLGLSLEAARARVRRGRWLKITDNHGTVRVSVPVFALNKTPEQTERVDPDVHPVRTPEHDGMFTPDNTALSTLRDMMGLLQTELNERRQEVADYREENAVLKEQNAQLREQISRIDGERVHPTHTPDVHPVQRPVFTLNVHPEQTRSYGGYARRSWWWPFG
ncbi:hypothetical protein GCM10007872_31070 [Gluconobacter sphaericus NBRC 12467]|uniref:DNA-binding protein n=1 Tax=Gluconobacter sphaericus NBRC 12467 TaxID=1307951 RepID=A0AA37SJL5_9PROT|nr:hypothetical protein AA12467_0629 [Gluconobacter sphaericus NBRC 12467]GEB43997.1 hypothetical protein GSP01_27790 [Gluconobacter sphaericus NBRC 12467]GLQ86194.1 hypothetical protein GCM10007872_31070 [Gluconobacter sphaericus NBRC 12467]